MASETTKGKQVDVKDDNKEVVAERIKNAGYNFEVTATMIDVVEPTKDFKDSEGSGNPNADGSRQDDTVRVGSIINATNPQRKDFVPEEVAEGLAKQTTKGKDAKAKESNKDKEQEEK